MNSLFVFLCLCLLASTTSAFGQIALDRPMQLRFPLLFRIVIPYVDTETASFAYVKQSGTTQSLELASLTNAFLLPTAESVATLATVDTDSDVILDLYASPDNRWLAAYNFQDPGFGFVDHNLRFYDMLTGDALGLRNEHSFSDLKESILPSQRLNEYRDALSDLGAPDEVLAAIDYAVATEDANIPFPSYQWNQDGTFSLSFELDVLAVEEGFATSIGSETFTLTFAVSDSGLTNAGFGPPPPAAAFPPVFSLTPAGADAGTLRFEGNPIRFRRWYYSAYLGTFVIYYAAETGELIEGAIPRQYMTLP